MGRRRTRVPFSEAERAIVWQRWGEGARYPHIARELGRDPMAIAYVIMRHGGIAPPRRHRSARVLSLPEMQVSHETIYRTLYVQARGALKKELVQHLRRSKGVRRNRNTKRTGLRRGQIVDAIPISERPPEAADRAVPGHWEGDLLAGNKTSNIATLVERRSRFVMLIRLPKRDTHSVMKALARRVQTLPAELKKSLTWDRGLEMAQHKEFTVATDVQVYFCDPQSPWQRGANENTNGLLRQYLPKGIDLSAYSQAQLNALARRLNQRPRKTLLSFQ